MDSLIRIAGAVALLFWGTYMVKTAMLRAFGLALRTGLARWLKNRFAGFLSGAALAALLQSSTASALLVAGLQGEGVVTTAMALSAVLGADLGSAVMARILAMDLSLLSPVLILAGTVLFLKRPGDRAGQLGRFLLGLGLILAALQGIFAASAPFKSEAGALLDAVNHSAALSLLSGAALAGCAFSSLAAVIITAGLAAHGVLAGSAPLWVILGANLGSAILAVLTTAGGTPTARRAPAGNLFFRCSGVIAASILVLALPGLGREALGSLGPIGVHIAFNAAIGLSGLLFIGPVSRMLEKWLPERITPEHRNPLALSEENLLAPEAALATAKAEAMRDLESLMTLWARLADFIRGNPPESEADLEKEKRRSLGGACRSMTLFLSALVQLDLSTEDTRRWQLLQRLNEAVRSSSSAAGDILDALVKNKCARGLAFSKEGESELLALHQEVGENLARLRSILSADDDDARSMLAQEIRRLSEEIAAHELPLISQHMARVASGLTKSEETSALHVELLALMRRFNALIAAAVS